MAFNKLEDTNALLLYRVGPVQMCSPTLQVESVVVPPAISRANAVSDAEPGMFRSMYGMVRVVDLRVRFGVDAAQRKQPGQIVIVEVVGGHAGFWVDEIEDVIAFPQTGWSQVPSHVPGSVFSRTLLQGDDIRLYAEFDQLDGFKTSGYLREHIRNLQQAAQKEPAASAATTTTKPAEHTQPLSTPGRNVLAAQADNPLTPDAESSEHPAEVDTAVQPPVKTITDAVTTRSDDLSPAQTRQGISGHKDSKQAEQRLIRPALVQTARRQTHYRPQAVDAGATADRLSVSSANQKAAVAAPAERIGDDALQARVTPPATLTEQTNASWLWWFVPLLLLFIVLFIFMQKNYLQQILTAQDEGPILQDRVDFQQDVVEFQTEKTLDNNTVQSATLASGEVEAELKTSLQMADDLTDVIYIEPDSGDLTITLNDYEEDSPTGNEPTVEASVQRQMEAKAEPDSKQQLSQQLASQEHQVESQQETQQLLPGNRIAGTESMQAVSASQAVATQDAELEKEKLLPVKTEVTDKTLAQTSRRLQHIVVKGDTLWSIAGRYINKPWRYPEIARLSNIDNPHLIYPGQRVIIILNYKNRSE